MEIAFSKAVTEKDNMNDNMQKDQPEVSIHQKGISSQQENNEIKGETIQTTKRKTGKLTKREIRELSTTNHNINKWLSKATIKKAENEDMDEVVEAMETEEIPDIGEKHQGLEKPRPWRLTG